VTTLTSSGPQRRSVEVLSTKCRDRHGVCRHENTSEQQSKRGQTECPIEE